MKKSEIIESLKELIIKYGRWQTTSLEIEMDKPCDVTFKEAEDEYNIIDLYLFDNFDYDGSFGVGFRGELLDEDDECVDMTVIDAEILTKDKLSKLLDIFTNVVGTEHENKCGDDDEVYIRIDSMKILNRPQDKETIEKYEADHTHKEQVIKTSLYYHFLNSLGSSVAATELAKKLTPLLLHDVEQFNRECGSTDDVVKILNKWLYEVLVLDLDYKLKL
jgi:TATA-binding protein-associated factor Taf7